MCMFVYVATFKRVLVFNNPSCFPPPEKDETGQVLSLYKKKQAMCRIRQAEWEEQ